MRVRLTQIDGKLPNLALMKLAHWHRAQGHEIHFTRSPYRSVFEQDYDRVYGSAIFDFSVERVARFVSEFPGAIVGGSWNDIKLKDLSPNLMPFREVYARFPVNQTIEHILGTSEIPADHLDYSLYPSFDASIGFATRGCRLKCGFCSVPRREGKPRPVSTIAGIWRGGDHPRNIHLLDNDFFGRPGWELLIEEIVEGGYSVCFNQGINIRMVNDQSAAALASLKVKDRGITRILYRDDGFKKPRLYTAWDSIGDEAVFLKGVETLAKHGIPPTHLMAYMLIGYDQRETWARVLYRFNRMVALGIKPFPMVYGHRHRNLPVGETNQRLEKRTLGEFQRWAVGKFYQFVEFQDYDAGARGRGTAGDAQQLSFLMS